MRFAWPWSVRRAISPDGRRLWLAWPGTTALIASEYNKFLAAWLRHFAKRMAPVWFGPDATKEAA